MPFNTTIITAAARHLIAGGLVGLPTETVYGLGCDATNDAAVASVFAAKGRPQFNPLILHFADAEGAKRHVQWNARAQKLADQFWPGPLTLVLRRRADSPISLLASAGLDTLAVRVPQHAMAREFLSAVGVPVAAPSANPSGRISPTTAAHVRSEFPHHGVQVLDGGPCVCGIESTVVELLDTPTLLRLGSITQAMLEACLRELIDRVGDEATIRSPGQLLRHYAPNTPLRLNASSIAQHEALLAFGSPLQGGVAVRNLSPDRVLEEAAANLFRQLRELDGVGAHTIAVMPIPNHGIGEAINDRLARAAH